MRVLTVSMLLALLACQVPAAVAQNAAASNSLPTAIAQNAVPSVRPGVVGAIKSPGPNIPPVSPQSRYRYQTGHWWYRGPNPLGSTSKSNEREEYEPPVYTPWSSNRLGSSSLSRYSFGYRPQWNPYSGYNYGYNGGFGRSLYGYGNGYSGLKNGYLGFGGNGHFSNGAFNTGN